MSKRLGHIKQLDSLRTIAAFMVILHHYLNEYGIGNFAFGEYGVEIFFVISGFLITAILLKQRSAEIPVSKKIKNFIIKRALRLFPVYYLLLILFSILALFGLYSWNEGNAIYFYTYTSNILFYNTGWGSVQLNHVWTLAVEEQFYIFWPFLIFFVPKKKLLYLFLGLILFSLFFKSLAIPRSRLLTIYHFDTLASGALLAYLLNSSSMLAARIKRTFERIPTTSILVGFLGIVALSVLSELPVSNFIIVDLISLLLVIGCIYRYKGLFGRIMDSKAMIHLGQISYGLYIYHKPIPFFFKIIAGHFGYQTFNPYLLTLASIGLTIVIAELSYRIIEKPMIVLKARFDI